MTERLKDLVSAIESVAEDFIADRNDDEKNYWNEWLSGHRHLTLNIFAELKKLYRDYRRHPDYMAVITGKEYVDSDGLMALEEQIKETENTFYTSALRVMIRDTDAHKIQSKITEVEYRVNSDGISRWTTKWSMLESDKSMNDEAWAHIGKRLTYRLFSDVYAKENRKRGRPKRDNKSKQIFVAKRIIALKRMLYRPFYSLAPFTDVEIVDALLSDHNNQSLVSILQSLGLSNAVSTQTVCNMVSAGRGNLMGFELSEDGHIDSDEKNILSEEAISMDERIAGAEDYLGPLTELDKVAIKNGFSCPTEVISTLDRNNLTEVDLETIMLWKIMPEQIKAVTSKAKTLFNLSEFKNATAEAKARNYW